MIKNLTGAVLVDGTLTSYGTDDRSCIGCLATNVYTHLMRIAEPDTYRVSQVAAQLIDETIGLVQQHLKEHTCEID